MKQRPHFSWEDQSLEIPVCGVDEVGRGPLAGPVVAAAVILDRIRLPLKIRDKIDDSKKLSPRLRAFLAQEIPYYATVAIASCEVEEIDHINILQASLLAMKKAIDALSQTPQTVLVDGRHAPCLSVGTVKTIIGGDRESLSIAAASILAKHHRDEIMKKYAQQFPDYGWDRNAGYGTAEHLKAIKIHGVTPLHRRTFRPISEILLQKKNINN